MARVGIGDPQPEVRARERAAAWARPDGVVAGDGMEAAALDARAPSERIRGMCDLVLAVRFPNEIAENAVHQVVQLGLDRLGDGDTDIAEKREILASSSDLIEAMKARGALRIPAISMDLIAELHAILPFIDPVTFAGQNMLGRLKRRVLGATYPRDILRLRRALVDLGERCELEIPPLGRQPQHRTTAQAREIENTRDERYVRYRAVPEFVQREEKIQKIRDQCLRLITESEYAPPHDATSFDRYAWASRNRHNFGRLALGVAELKGLRDEDYRDGDLMRAHAPRLPEIGEATILIVEAHIGRLRPLISHLADFLETEFVPDCLERMRASDLTEGGLQDTLNRIRIVEDAINMFFTDHLGNINPFLDSYETLSEQYDLVQGMVTSLYHHAEKRREEFREASDGRHRRSRGPNVDRGYAFGGGFPDDSDGYSEGSADGDIPGAIPGGGADSTAPETLTSLVEAAGKILERATVPDKIRKRVEWLTAPLERGGLSRNAQIAVKFFHPTGGKVELLGLSSPDEAEFKRIMDELMGHAD